MKTQRMAFLAVLLLLLAPAASRAEYYKYHDEKGVIRYTDNLAEVPKDQRDAAKRYEEYVAPPGEKKPVVTPAPSPAAGTRAAKPSPGGTVDVADLNRRRDGLEYQYGLLLEEKRALEQEQKKVRGKQEIERYNAKVKKLNQKISEYDKRRAKFDKEADRLNAPLR